MSWRAERANAKGIALEEKGWHTEAQAAYEKAALLDPSGPFLGSISACLQNGSAGGPSAGPLELNMGLVPIRLALNNEVVWCSRIDPARAIIRSGPLPESQRAFGDLLLHDGATNGSRWLRGKEVGVFDELEILEHCR